MFDYQTKPISISEKFLKERAWYFSYLFKSVFIQMAREHILFKLLK